jgi:2'-5' RNA ligase
MAGDGVRCFLALFPDGPTRDALARRAAGLPAPLRSVPAGNLHLTLAFLGVRDEGEIAVWSAVIRGERFAAVEGRSAGWCWLPDPRRPRVGAVAVDSDGVVEARAAWLRERLGLPSAERFLPHVTLVRWRNAPAPATPTVPELPLRFDRLGLYASTPASGGRRYRPLAEAAPG